MGNRSYVFDHVNFQTCCLQGTDCGLTAGARAFDIYFHRFQTMFHSGFCSGLGSGLCCERSRFSGTSESKSACTCPRKGVALYVGDGNNGVVKGGLDMCGATFDVFAFTTPASGAFSLLLLPSLLSLPSYFFLLAMVFFGPLRVLALVLVRWPLTGRPFL